MCYRFPSCAQANIEPPEEIHGIISFLPCRDHFINGNTLSPYPTVPSGITLLEMRWTALLIILPLACKCDTGQDPNLINSIIDLISATGECSLYSPSFFFFFSFIYFLSTSFAYQIVISITPLGSAAWSRSIIITEESICGLQWFHCIVRLHNNHTEMMQWTLSCTFSSVINEDRISRFKSLWNTFALETQWHFLIS